MSKRGLTFRALSARTRDADTRERGLTHSYLAGIAQGRETPSVEAMELIASALEVDPAEFTEYRLLRTRRLFDERESGLEVASSNLDELIKWVADGSVRRTSTLAKQVRSV